MLEQVLLYSLLGPKSMDVVADIRSADGIGEEVRFRFQFVILWVFV